VIKVNSHDHNAIFALNTPVTRFNYDVSVVVQATDGAHPTRRMTEQGARTYVD